MGDLDATLGHHLDQVPVRKPIGDVPAHAQLNNVGVECPFAVDRVTGDRLRHSAPRANDSAVYPMPLDAPEPSNASTLEISLERSFAVSPRRTAQGGVWGATEQRVRLRIGIGGVSERPQLAPGDRFGHG